MKLTIIITGGIDTSSNGIKDKHIRYIIKIKLNHLK